MAAGIAPVVMKMADIVHMIDERAGPPKLRGPYKKREAMPAISN